MFVKLKKAAVYKGKKYVAGDIVEVGDDLGNRMILAGQALRSNKAAFEKQKEERKDAENGNLANLEDLTVKQLEELARQKGIELQPKMKKADIIEAIKAAD